MTDQPPEARRAPIKKDVLAALEASDELVELLERDEPVDDASDVIAPKNQLDKGDDSEPDEPVLVLVGVVGETSTQRNIATVDAGYLVQVLVLRSAGHARRQSGTWIDEAHDAIAIALTHESAGGTIPTGQSAGIEEQWSEQRNRWMSDKTFEYRA